MRPAAGLRRASRLHEPCLRRALAAAARNAGHTLAGLSRLIGRDDRYLSRFIRLGTPAALTDADRRALSDFLGVEERGLGVRTLWVGAR